MEQVKAKVVAIDGPAGAGKSTVASLVAERLGLVRIDTGAIYRALTLLLVESGSPDAVAADLMPTLDLRFEGQAVLLGARDVSDAIRTQEVTARVSSVSARPEVRQGLLALQKRLAAEDGRGAVLEGRDIGTVVFPNAAAKVFLTASAEARAKRRWLELQAQGRSDSLEQVLASIIERDRQDSQRSVAPLRKADDAFEVESTGKDIETVVDEIVRLARQAWERAGLTPPLKA